MSTKHKTECATRMHIGRVADVEKVFKNITIENSIKKVHVTDHIHVVSNTGTTVFDRGDFRSLYGHLNWLQMPISISHW